jgi:hypothetical protein
VHSGTDVRSTQSSVEQPIDSNRRVPRVPQLTRLDTEMGG